jgi:hypothetical protein
VRLCLDSQSHAERIEITVAAHGGIRARCSLCQKPAPGYDRLPERRWLFVPLWGYRPGSVMRHGGLSALNTAWWSNTFPGATASGR